MQEEETDRFEDPRDLAANALTANYPEKIMQLCLAVLCIKFAPSAYDPVNHG